MDGMRLLFEAVPVVLAVIAILLCSERVIATRRARDRQIYAGMVLCAMLLVVAQSSWSNTVLQGLSTGTNIADIVWTVFNSCVMLVFILSASRK